MDAAPHLEQLARGEALNQHVLGMRGYVRLAGVEPSGEKKATMLLTAMKLSRRPIEKRRILGAWGKVNSEQSLDVLRPYLDDAELANEAASAIVSVASELGEKEETRPAALEALRAVVEKCENEDIRKQAERKLAEWEKAEEEEAAS